MDLNDLLDLTEELLNMYGYETRRNVGVVGGKIATTELAHELGTLKEEGLVKKEEEGTVYKADIFAEKKDIERPFGRIIVRYKRGHDPVSPNDVNHAQAVAKAAQAYSALLLTITGYTPEAEEVALTQGNITIMTPDRVQELLGKAMTKERWWFNAPAYPLLMPYDRVMERVKWFFDKMLFINFDCIWFFNKELAYEPYWKFSYHVARRKGEKLGEARIKKKELEKRSMAEGFFAINAFTGEVDVWTEIAPEKDPYHTLKEVYVDKEAINMVERRHIAPRTKIEKPKLPAGVNYVVYRPAMEKHEAKLAAIQWISYIHNVDPEDVVITGRELIYYPWWKFYYFYRPIVKNAWLDTEWTGFKVSGVFGYVYNHWKSIYSYFKRDIIYYYMEKSLLKMLGMKRYVRWMRKITYAITVLWWDYHIVLRPAYIWALLLAITAGTIYAFITATWGLSIILGILLVVIFMGPGYAFLYIIQKNLQIYPRYFGYPHPKLTKREWKKWILPKIEAKAAFEELEELEKEGKLTEKERKELIKLRDKKVKEELKKAKKKKFFR